MAERISEITHFQITTETNYQAITSFVNVSHVAGHEGTGKVLFQCRLYSLSTDNIEYLTCSIDIQEIAYDWLLVSVIHTGWR